jgi:hypothetical protein
MGSHQLREKTLTRVMTMVVPALKIRRRSSTNLRQRDTKRCELSAGCGKLGA